MGGEEASKKRSRGYSRTMSLVFQKNQTYVTASTIKLTVPEIKKVASDNAVLVKNLCLSCYPHRRSGMRNLPITHDPDLKYPFLTTALEFLASPRRLRSPFLLVVSTLVS